MPRSIVSQERVQGTDNELIKYDDGFQESITRPQGYWQPLPAGPYPAAPTTASTPSIPGSSPAPTVVSNTSGIQDMVSQANSMFQNIPGVGNSGFEGVLGSSNGRVGNGNNNSNGSIGSPSSNTVFNLDQLVNQYNQIGVQTQQEIAQIEAAGQAAGAQYDPLIMDATEERRKGQPKAIVGAGRRGGFMRARFAGEAALGPTEGGTFEGQGGVLQDVKSAYDRNINNLQNMKNTAIAQAKIAAQQAIRTGKSDMFAAATRLYELAQKANKDAQDMIFQKMDYVFKFNQEQRNALNDEVSRFSSLQEGLSKLPVGQKITINGQEYEGRAVPESAKPFFSGSDIISLMKSIPKGESEQLTDPITQQIYTITGLDSETVTSTDNGGNVYGIDKNTGQIKWAAKGIGKTGGSGTSVSINMAAAQSGDLNAALEQLESTKGKDDGKYNSAAVNELYKFYAAKYPGKVNQFKDLIKGDVNYSDNIIKNIFTSGVPKGQSSSLTDLFNTIK